MGKFPSLSKIVLKALRLHQDNYSHLPRFDFGHLKEGRKRLVVASGNALPTGKIIFEGEENVVFADEGQYKSTLKKNPVGSVVVISASGEKDAPKIVRHCLDRGIDTYLLTCEENSTAADFVRQEYSTNPESHVFVTLRTPEPITYNTSTYLGMIFAKTRNKPSKILEHIERHVKRRIPHDLRKYRAVYIMVPPKYDGVREMFVTKFDELFGPMLVGRCYTSEQTRHAKTVVPSKRELFISIDLENEMFGHPDSRLNIPLPKRTNPAAMIAVGYYVIGKIQEQKPDYFGRNAERYEREQKHEIFDNKKFKKQVRKYKK